ncbi:MAG: hypothetical protein CM15mP120_26530 [Pseudomonadota bacterium]|nr:MAG: hypothetical protein CM15mP120_26530 [Pseudomonadota bacterium]
MDANFSLIVGVFAALVVFCLVAKRCASLLQPSAAAPCCSPAPAPLCGGALTLALQLIKGALRNLAKPWQKNTHKTAYMLAMWWSSGPIAGEKIKRGLPEYAERLGEDGMISIDGIVDGLSTYIDNRPRPGRSRLDVRTAKEKW